MAYSKVERRTWNDERFRRWPKDRRDVWLYLLTTPHLDQPGGRFGCCVLDPMYAAADLSAPDDRWTPERVERQLAELEQEGRIVWDPDARLVLLVRFFDHNRPENPNVVKGMVRDIEAAPYSERVMINLFATVRERLPERFEKGGELGVAILAAIEGRMEREKENDPNPLPANNINPSERVAGTVPKGLPQPFAIQEHEHKQEQITTTEDKSSEAGPREVAPLKSEHAEQRTPPNSNSENGGGAASPSAPESPKDARRRMNAIAAPLIREHFWLGKDPPLGATRKHPGWGMKRELNILAGLMKDHDATPEEIGAVIEYARPVLEFGPEEPLSALIFQVEGRRDRFRQVLDYARIRRAKEERLRQEREPKPAGNVRIQLHVA